MHSAKFCKMKSLVTFQDVTFFFRGLCICYAYHSTLKSLDKLMPKSVMDYKKMKADYIYLPEMNFQRK